MLSRVCSIETDKYDNVNYQSENGLVTVLSSGKMANSYNAIVKDERGNPLDIDSKIELKELRSKYNRNERILKNLSFSEFLSVLNKIQNIKK